MSRVLLIAEKPGDLSALFHAGGHELAICLDEAEAIYRAVTFLPDFVLFEARFVDHIPAIRGVLTKQPRFVAFGHANGYDCCEDLTDLAVLLEDAANLRPM